MLPKMKSGDIVTMTARAPYDGCWWERNYWLSAGDRAYPLYISGDIDQLFLEGRLPTENVYLEAMRVGVAKRKFRKYLGETDRYDDVEVVASRDADIAYNLYNSIIELLQFHGCPDAHLPAIRCERCGADFRGEAKFMGYHGNGGIGVELTDPMCPQCWESSKWCESCWEHVIPIDGACPNRVMSPMSDHPLSDPADCAEELGIRRIVLPNQGEGPPPVVVIWQKNP